ncbi:serine/threonine protein kinase [Leptolyngbyaceae cyanobacterium JSC-12]|nr:serine/threonine protein kinase [Leptolyngbyaceae cyanobacterium JSC-12]
MPGQILGNRYQVERQLGKQTGRWTLLTRDLQTQERVIVKLIFIDERLEPDDLKLFEREVEILKSLSHPSIPRYIGYFEQELPNAKALALIQTYVEGRSLEQCLQQGRLFTEAETKQVAKALLGILSYLHGRTPPIIHRDIKPSNILLANRQLYLVDFGSVKRVSGNDTTAFTVVGTYGYMPPEQFSGRAVPSSDLYSLGATLLALVTGTHPSSLVRSGTKVDFSQISQISPEFADWLSWLYEANLERRAKSAQEALQALDHGRPSPPPTAPAIAPPVRKPADTKITLSKDPTFLEITIPSRMGQIQLQIDQYQITLSSKKLGIPAGRAPVSARKDIHRLEYQKPAAPFPPGGEEDPHITIWAGEQKYELRGTPPLTKPELDWLAYELSSWLQLPIS